MKKVIPLFLTLILLFCGCAQNTESMSSGSSTLPPESSVYLSSEAISSMPAESTESSSETSAVSEEPSEPSTVSEDIGEPMTQAEFDDFFDNILPEVVTLISGRQQCDPTDSITDNDIVYYKVTDQKYNTVEKLKAEFAKYFTAEYIDENFDSYFASGKPYKEKEGTIYTHIDYKLTTFEIVNKHFYRNYASVNTIYLSSDSKGVNPFLSLHFEMERIDGEWKICYLHYSILTPSPTPAMKPMIYLYPEKVTDVTVKLDLKGTLGCTYPKYPEDGWQVTAYPGGKLIVDGEEYNYLFWEGELNTVFAFDKGFCVKGSDTAAFLKKALSEMGLIQSEYNDFIVYWLPQMEENTYNLISFIGVDYTDNAKLEITPKPDSVLRVFMIIKPLKQPVEIAPQTFEKFERNGFTVVEWGGAEID